MATKKLSEALLALATPEFGNTLEIPGLSIGGEAITSSVTQLNYLNTATGNIQTQISGKAASTHAHDGAHITSGTVPATRLPDFSTTSKGVVPLSGTATGSQVLADNGWTSKNNVYTAFQALSIVAGTATWTMTSGYNATLNLTSNAQLAFAGIADGMCGCLIITQGGGYTLTLPANSLLLGASELVLTSTAYAIDILTFVYHAPAYYWSLGNNYLDVSGA